MATSTPNTGDASTTSSTAAQPSQQQFQVEGEENLTELETNILREYQVLVQNLNELAPLLAELAQSPTAAILDSLRMLERKTSLVSTLLKASVYSIVLQQEMLDDDGGGGGDAGDAGENH